MKSSRGYAIRPDTPPDRRPCAWCGRQIALFGKAFARQNPTKMHPHTANGKKATRENQNFYEHETADGNGEARPLAPGEQPGCQRCRAMLAKMTPTAQVEAR